jgi:hypothetical protein
MLVSKSTTATLVTGSGIASTVGLTFLPARYNCNIHSFIHSNKTKGASMEVKWRRRRQHGNEMEKMAPEWEGNGEESASMEVKWRRRRQHESEVEKDTLCTGRAALSILDSYKSANRPK